MVDLTESKLIEAADTDPGYGQLFAVLMRRRFWLLGVFSGVVSIAAVLTFLAEPIYQSSMQLLVESNYQSKKGENGSTEVPFADATVEVDNATQLTLMRSSHLLQRAVKILKPQYPDVTVAEIQKSLVLTQLMEDKVKTKVFQAVYTDSDPEKTKKVLQAIQKVYQDYNREQQQQRLSKGLSFITDQVPKVQRQVNQAEDALEKFRDRQNLIDPEAQSKALFDALNSVRQEQRTNQAQLKDMQARYVALQQQVKRSPQEALVASRLSQSSRYQTLLNELQKSELTLEQQRLRFKDFDPHIKSLLEQRQRQLGLLRAEVSRVLGTVPAQFNASGNDLLKAGQLGATDLTLITQLVEAQVNTRALQARGQSLSQTEQQLTAELKRFPRLLAEYGRLQPNVEVGRETLQQLLKAKQELALEIARGGFDWQVVEAAQLGTQIGPSLKQNLLLGAVAGLILGSVAAFVREGIDDAVHSSDELEKQVAVPLLGLIPAVPRSGFSEPMLNLSFRKTPALAPATLQVVDWPPFRESLDLIYKNIQLLNSTFPFSSLVVTSALSGEGKSTLALGLAMSAARLHQRVLLIDADLRRPSLHKQLNLPNEQGLSTLLASDRPITEEHSYIQPAIAYSNISILTAGPTPADPAKLLSSRRMAELISTFEESYDLVLLDAPPVLGIVDAILTASFCSGVLMVGRMGQVTRSELTQATNMLSKLNMVGVIANGAEMPANNYLPYARSA
ncbi:MULTISPECIES: polysaccharide biosynthesis tyrosine autokinase [Trichocoleus]|uniref:Polysaccharide biosynthesis tyrosine autokinase n=1 Tax=Trichocoleus desertorum GB2-A4 TaxID=2933944 RepID=A0ABV0J5X6_9CYAN|nr:polysaccharide biosynthesis tyrosine autokinase [Trichocoleus sp. FACHB-46]MBD1863891.1 polysaccharide biosynthesis tyrosine autokinase [Trichocoleus sp. FACHB-46]